MTMMTNVTLFNIEQSGAKNQNDKHKAIQVFLVSTMIHDKANILKKIMGLKAIKTNSQLHVFCLLLLLLLQLVNSATENYRLSTLISWALLTLNCV